MTDDAPDRPPPAQDNTERRKSETRQRTATISARATPDEKAAFLARADRVGMTSGAFLRAVALGDAGPRAQRKVTVDGRAVREVIGHLGKVGSNLNQIARYLNTGGSAGVLEQDIRAALADEARLRGLLYQAISKTPDGAAPETPPPAIDEVFERLSRDLRDGGDTAAALQDMRQALANHPDIRALLIEALGESRHPAPPADQPPPSGTKSVPPPHR